MLILKGLKVLCFHILLQVLILKGLSSLWTRASFVASHYVATQETDRYRRVFAEGEKQEKRKAETQVQKANLGHPTTVLIFSPGHPPYLAEHFMGNADGFEMPLSEHIIWSNFSRTASGMPVFGE